MQSMGLIKKRTSSGMTLPCTMSSSLGNSTASMKTILLTLQSTCTKLLSLFAALPTATSESFVIHPTIKSCPAGQETSKQGDAVNFIIDEVTKQASDAQKHPSGNGDQIMSVLEKTLLESNQQMQIIAQQATMANHQIMMSAPPEVRNVYFDKIYRDYQSEDGGRGATTGVAC